MGRALLLLLRLTTALNPLQKLLVEGELRGEGARLSASGAPVAQAGRAVGIAMDSGGGVSHTVPIHKEYGAKSALTEVEPVVLISFPVSFSFS